MTLPRSILEGGSPIGNGNGGAPSGGAGPVQRLQLVRPALPCPGCIHAAVCSIRPLIEEAVPEFRTPPTPHDAIRVTVAVSIECSHFAPGQAEPDPPQPQPTTSGDQLSRIRGGEATRAKSSKSKMSIEPVVAMLREKKGSIGGSAFALGVAAPTLHSFVKGHLAEIPTDVRDLVDARKRK